MNMAVFLWLYYRIDEYATFSIESSKTILKEAAQSSEKSTQHMQHEKSTNTTTQNHVDNISHKCQLRNKTCLCMQQRTHELAENQNTVHNIRNS
jgi:hypothetical protein